MVGANGPVRGPHPVRASGKSVKDDSSPVRGPHPIRASEQEKEIQGGMVGKKESGATARVAVTVTTRGDRGRTQRINKWGRNG